jgi:hypothetical protein
VSRNGGQLQLRALDVEVQLDVEDGTLADLLRGLLADLMPNEWPETSRAQRIVVTGVGEWRVRGDGIDQVTSTLPGALTLTLASLNTRIIASTGLLAIHAGVVTRGDRLLVLPGRSGHGKSTLVAALLRCGWDYVSDEALGLTWSEGQVIGYPRPLGLSAWSARALDVAGHDGQDGEVFLSAAELGARAAGVTGERVTDVLLSERMEGVESLATARRPDAVSALLACGFTHHRQPARALQLVVDMLRDAEVWRLRHGHPLAAAQLLTDRIG